ncbi:MAG TPA: carboxypeptidase regulatory-like domain-containing protein [Candidatus Binatia bacterium]|nr:carboxypeptidase regulatory-like domain-containing protein [Candidatus Binatia bacterium]
MIQCQPRAATGKLAILLLIALLAPVVVRAQATISTGTIQGTISDPTGAVVSDAKVTISNKATGQTIGLVTSSTGAYATGALLPGTYVVRVEKAGFRSAELAVAVSVGVITGGNIRLEVGLESQVLEVSATSVQVNTEQPIVQGVLTSQQIETLPISGRNFLDLAQLEPGVQIQDGGNFDPTKNGFSSISFGGRFGRTARISVDGLDISDETVGTTTQNISAGAIGEFQLSQSTLDLSTELTSSGAVNVVTKSGTNTLHGDAFYLFRDKSMMANFPGGQDTYYQRNHFGGSIGGAIVKDKLFFFANAERVKQGLTVPLAPPPPFENLPHTYPGGFKDTMTMGKLDWHIKPNMTFFYRITYEWNGDTRAYGSTYQPFTNRDNTPGHAAGLDFTTGGFNHSIRFGYLRFQNHISDAVTGNPGIYNPGASAGIAIRIGPAGVETRFGPSRLAPQATFQGNTQIKYDGSRLVASSHILRYGISYNRIRGGGFASFYGIAPEARTSVSDSAQTDADSGPYPGGRANPLNYSITAILLGNGQGFFTEKPAFGYPAGGQWDDRLGIYFGDSWKIKPNFTLTYGLRWSRDTGRADSDLAPLTCNQIDASLFPAPDLIPCTGSSLLLDQFGQTGIGGRVRQPNTNFGPQLGFAWDPSKKGKTVIRGGAGLYYENGIFNNIMFDRPGRLPKGLFWGTATPCSSNSLSLPGQGPIDTVDGVSIATICSSRVGDYMTQIADMQQLFETATTAAGPQANGNFLGETLANGYSSTGNGFIASNFRSPRSYQMNIGIQHEFRRGMVVSADFLRNVGLRYLISYDTNHVGDARYLNKNAALNAISATNASFGCGSGTDAASIDCAITAGALIGDYADNGLDSGKMYNSGYPASIYYGVSPDFGAAFPGINPLVGENEMLFPVGRSTYTGLQAKWLQNASNPFRGVKNVSLQVSYSLSRFNSMASDQDFIPSAWDFRDPAHYYGPNSLDRTHQLSFGATFDLPHGPQLSFVSHFFSPLPQDMYIENQARSGEIFMSDVVGDGSPYQHILPGTDIGAFGRNVKANNINTVISKYNSTIGGTLLPAGKALVDAGLLSSDQLVQLGAVADTLPSAPADQMNMSWARAFDVKFAWPIKIKDRFTIEPSVAFFNAFNFSNFNSASNYLSGFLNGSAGTVNGTAMSDAAARDSLRVGAGTGVNTAGAPRQIEFALKIKF